MIEREGEQVLKAVSRSFHLSLRLLPAAMRRAAGLGYLLARGSDTLADMSAPADVRRAALDSFAAAVADGRDFALPMDLREACGHAGERRLLGMIPEVIARLAATPAAEAKLIREVVGIITSGQRLDIDRFGEGSVTRIIAVADDAELDDYTWRVAGCVGAFWTKLGFLTLGSGFSRENPERLLELGVSYGKGLQLVNILRDLPEDFARGRCYLPAADPSNFAAVLRERDRWLEIACGRMEDGSTYAETLRSRRLRVASALPAMIGGETLRMMRGTGWDTLSARVKVPRTFVYQALARALCGRFR